MLVRRCPRCDKALSGRQPVHWKCAFRRGGIPLSILTLSLLIIAGGVILVVHFV
jgi:hypothetical protein